MVIGSVDPDRVVISINDKFRSLQPLSSGCCIYKIPENFRKLNEDAYRPWVVSIGPFHHNDEKLKPMQEQKLRYLQSLLKRNEDKNIDHYVQLVRDRLEDICNCYNQQIGLDDDAFVEMLLLDAAFIIEFLRHILESELTEMGFIGNSTYLMKLILRDMVLEENQLPFFVLNDIYNLANPGAMEEGFPFIRITIATLVKNSEQPIQDMTANAEIKHFLDLLRLSFLPSTPETKPNHSEDDQNMTATTFFPSVTELHEAGLKFKVSTSENLLDISFNNGVLQIPRLHLRDTTESVFRNLVVFEQLHLFPNHYITDYIKFLDGLINTAEDINILVQNGIIYNGLGSNDNAATLINSLCGFIVPSRDFYYSGVCNSLNKYMSSKWHKWRAILNRKYFSHPWAVISVIYAIVLLILTILSVITGFIQIS